MGGLFSRWRGQMLDVKDSLRNFARNLTDESRDARRNSRAKVALICGYLTVSVATVLVFPTPGELNEIDAEVQIRRTEIVGGFYFWVANQSDKAWEDMLLTLNDSFTTRWPRLRPGRKRAFYFNRFKNKQGKAPPENLKVARLRIDCRNGSFARDFSHGGS